MTSVEPVSFGIAPIVQHLHLVADAGNKVTITYGALTCFKDVCNFIVLEQKLEPSIESCLLWWMQRRCWHPARAPLVDSIASVDPVSFGIGLIVQHLHLVVDAGSKVTITFGAFACLKDLCNFVLFEHYCQILGGYAWQVWVRDCGLWSSTGFLG